MIQRIQTVYLFFIFVLSILLSTGSILTFSGPGEAEIRLKLLSALSHENGAEYVLFSTIPLAIIVIAAALTSLATIFLYRNRVFQIRLVKAIIVLSGLILITGFLYWTKIQDICSCMLLKAYKIPIPLFMIILAILSLRGIVKDENLVRSYDRLR